MSRDALVVGINVYQHLPSLNAPAQDAEAVARCLESFGECRVLRLPEAICHQKPAISKQSGVTTPMLEEALIRLFKPAGKNIPQTAIFYYSGHGLQRHAGIQEGYLATSDVNPATGHYGLSLYWLRRLLQESPVRQRVIILDCCNSGEFFNVLEADPGAKAGTDRLFMAASREYEAAYEALDGRHSVFTKALLAGLNPYKVKGGVVNGHSLTDTVTRQLKGELQQPLFESSGGEIVLTRLAGVAPAVQAPKTSTLEQLKHLSYGFCPFQGLAPFDTSHASLFFGREALTQALVEQVSEGRFCALIGASGIGKTSLLRAGLIHHLNQQSQSDRHPNWDIRYLTPGSAPLTSLAEAFVDPEVKGIQRAEQIRQAESFLKTGGQGLGQLLQAITKPLSTSQIKPYRLVLIIDQLEEIFQPLDGADLAQERQLLVDCLLAAVKQEHCPVHLVIGLRASYLQALQAFPELYELVTNQGLTVPAMTYDQVKSTIVGPLDRVGLKYDANLIYTLLLDVVGAPGDLALLQMTLKELWTQREFDPQGEDPPRLTLEAYAEMGGVRHLCSRQASRCYEGLSEAEQPIAERNFLSLCELAEGTTLTRRQVKLPELVTEAIEATQVLAVLEKLISAGVVVAQSSVSRPDAPGGLQSAALVPAWPGNEAGTAADGSPSPLAKLLQRTENRFTCQDSDLTPTFDIAHESLLRTWPLLQSWLQNCQPRLKQQRAIETAAQEWHQQQCPDHPDYFLSKTRLAEAQSLQTAYPGSLSTQAITYLNACQVYARRSARRRYLMKLLIPLSMVTGMLTAYGHNLITQPSHAGRTTQPVARLDSSPSPSLDPAQIAAGQTQRVSPPGGRGVSLRLGEQSPVGAGGSTSPGPGFMGLAPQLQRTVSGALHGFHSWAMESGTVPSYPGAGPSPLPSYPGSLSLAKSQLNKVAEWAAPDNPAVTIQVWCVRDHSEPTCFTLKSDS